MTDFAKAVRADLQQALGDARGELSSLLRPARQAQRAVENTRLLRRASRRMKPKTPPIST